MRLQIAQRQKDGIIYYPHILPWIADLFEKISVQLELVQWSSDRR